MPNFCANCGSPVNGPFCGSCGQQVKASSAPTPPPPVAPAPIQYAPLPAAPQRPSSRKPLLIGCAIVVILFGIGIVASVYSFYWVKNRALAKVSSYTGGAVGS